MKKMIMIFFFLIKKNFIQVFKTIVRTNIFKLGNKEMELILHHHSVRFSSILLKSYISFFEKNPKFNFKKSL